MCGLSRACPPDHYAVHISSGAANVVGPKICFDGKMYVCEMVAAELTEGWKCEWPWKTEPYLYLNSIMSHVLNNVGPGLNIVVVNGE